MGNDELRTLHDADQRDRINHPAYGTPEYWALRERDRQRRERVAELDAAGEIQTAEDCFHAALIMQHGDDVPDIAQAESLARRAAEAGYQPARWLAAAARDRWLMYQGRPQHFGTQIVPDGRRQRVWDVEPSTTDDERAAWDVPPLAEMERRAAELSEHETMPPMDDAPEWLKQALSRWAAAEGWE